jgi:hypothetical protein
VFIMESVWLRCSMFSKIRFVSVIGMLEYVCDVEGSKGGSGGYGGMLQFLN